MAIFFYAAVLSLLAVAAALDLDESVTTPPSFDDFAKLYGRVYRPGQPEYSERASQYERRVAEALSHNKQAGRLWNAGVNRFWDRTDVELLWVNTDGAKSSASNAPSTSAPRRFLAQVRNVTNRTTTAAHRDKSMNQTSTSTRLPREKSWAHLQVWSKFAIKDQGNCGSCWAITASTLLQAHSEIHAAKPRTFSVQELVSCVPNPNECGGKGGCKGATVGLALDWAWKNGVAQAHEVPYEAGWMGKPGVCTRPAASLLSKVTETGPSQAQGLTSFGSSGQKKQIAAVKKDPAGWAFGYRSWEKLPENQYEPLMRALVEIGPVSVSVASNEWYLYKNGIFDGCSKHATLGHAVVLMAYGEESFTKYWTIKNSWGDDWGEGGTMRLLRRDDEEQWCGTNFDPQQGTGCKGGPSKVTVCGACGILYHPTVPHFE
eukprot:gnl/TRDRNA2_/TRDRNA2_185042_c0_seq1.p1 gnl/TRDRNA2_/TRDRNA2_185042_c0~~gnl/TRDRNA2_/TRDRNA2_185042_c0_seq1.p1  ORF type:complete len:431 (-),score=59.54 gnl/TRDRNA2_/TRDRNA2_185042_c0_seq1:25-1317(-)